MSGMSYVGNITIVRISLSERITIKMYVKELPDTIMGLSLSSSLHVEYVSNRRRGPRDLKSARSGSLVIKQQDTTATIQRGRS